jgi:hypothetical protein
MHRLRWAVARTTPGRHRCWARERRQLGFGVSRLPEEAGNNIKFPLNSKQGVYKSICDSHTFLIKPLRLSKINQLVPRPHRRRVRRRPSVMPVITVPSWTPLYLLSQLTCAYYLSLVGSKLVSFKNDASGRHAGKFIAFPSENPCGLLCLTECCNRSPVARLLWHILWKIEVWQFALLPNRKTGDDGAIRKSYVMYCSAWSVYLFRCINSEGRWTHVE